MVDDKCWHSCSTFDLVLVKEVLMNSSHFQAEAVMGNSCGEWCAFYCRSACARKGINFDTMRLSDISYFFSFLFRSHSIQWQKKEVGEAWWASFSSILGTFSRFHLKAHLSLFIFFLKIIFISAKPLFSFLDACFKNCHFRWHRSPKTPYLCTHCDSDIPDKLDNFGLSSAYYVASACHFPGER